jgi:hypothetical protein
VLVGFCCAASANAQVVKFQFAGTIDESDSNLVRVGDPFSGTFAYDLVNFGFPDNEPTRSRHLKILGNPSIQMAYSAGSQTVERAAVVEWTTENRMTDSFTYAAQTSLGIGDLTEGTISLVDPTGTVFETDVPPATLNLADFAEHRFTGRLDPNDVPDGEIHNFSGIIDLLEPSGVLPPQGDFNQNGAVDAADYVLWRKTRGQAGEGLAADVTGPIISGPNGAVDEHDYNFWRAHFGQSTGLAGSTDSSSSASAAAPEPSTSLFTAILAAMVSCLNVRFRNK